MNLFERITSYHPINEQEEMDKKAMLSFMQREPDALKRENLTAHFTASAWTVNKERTKVLLIYHNLYNAWAWTGGHADGESDLLSVAMRELQEETGVTHYHPVTEDLFSLEVLTVDGHEKRGQYVPSHLHLNITYLIEADENDPLLVKPDENSGVKWYTLEEVKAVCREKWMVERIYNKLNRKLSAL